MKKGFTLIEVLVGVFLVLIVFLGIFGAYQLGLKVVGQSKNRIIATAIAAGELEKIRNLPYESIGIKNGVLPVPDGILDATTTAINNNIEYKIERQIKYIVDAADGIGGADLCDLDYKRAEIKVSWSGRFGGEVKLVTDIAPKNLTQECGGGGGVLSVFIYDVDENPVQGCLIEIKDPADDHTVTSGIASEEGKYNFPLLPGTYKVVVSYSNYNSERTYGIGEEYNGKIIAIPKKPHPIVLEGELTEISFADDSAIDRLSAFSVDTLFPWGADSFSDSFLNEDKISESSDVEISEGEVVLEKIDEEYKNSGYLVSKFFPVVPEDLLSWDEFSFNDSEPLGTQILYQVLYFNEVEEEWFLIPDSDLPCNPPECNSSGFSTSPVHLSELNITTYSQLELQANLSTNDPAATPILYDWQVSWKTSEATPITNATFHLQGKKIVGHDNTIEENPIYKYSQNHTTNGLGQILISNLEWDSYNFSIVIPDLGLVSIDPEPQPIYLPPDTTSVVKLYLDAVNSLLVIVKDIDTGESIPGAEVRLYKTGYEETQYAGAKGQTYFIPLEAGNYTADVSREGFQDKSKNISVSEHKIIIISLQVIW